MRRHFQALLAAAAIGTALSAIAATPDPATADTRANRRAEMKQRLFDQIDANHDGRIGRDEYRAWIDRRFERLDGNRDGSIDADEIATSPQALERVHKRAERFVRRFDANGSGKVSKADFEAKAMARFDRLASGADSIGADQLGGPGIRGRRHDSARDPSSAQ
ncbi:EF-hand domain-containing protein [Dokdonella sp.]|uniref:EF-hand domain-containing protein n=1 Tax=Dokdonella sp. TaxID=2291710 RepID=UPI003784D17C